MDKQKAILLSNYSCIFLVALNLAEPYLSNFFGTKTMFLLLTSKTKSLCFIYTENYFLVVYKKDQSTTG